jgi:Holliday junction resolvase RusA-like endonuclease
MSSFSFIIKGEPVPWLRVSANFTTRCLYDSQKSLKYVMGQQIAEAFGKKDLLKGPLEVTVYYYFPIPTGYIKGKRSHAPHSPYTSVPDIDNLNKFLYDLLKNIAIKDDRSIWKESCYKLWDFEPRTEFTLVETEK